MELYRCVNHPKGCNNLNLGLYNMTCVACDEIELKALRDRLANDPDCLREYWEQINTNSNIQRNQHELS